MGKQEKEVKKKGGKKLATDKRALQGWVCKAKTRNTTKEKAN